MRWGLVGYVENSLFYLCFFLKFFSLLTPFLFLFVVFLKLFQTTQALLPIGLVGICEMVWLLVYWFPWIHVKHLRRNMKSTAVALLYFLYPDLCTQCLAMFSCTNVCGQGNGFLTVDLDEPCYVGRHQTYVLSVAVPMLLVYVFGLPLMAYFSIKSIGNRARKKGLVMSGKLGVDFGVGGFGVGVLGLGFWVVFFNAKATLTFIFFHGTLAHCLEMTEDHFVFGLFYSMFKADTWWWEMTIAGRKVAIAVIGVFGARLGLMQVHLTMALVVFTILATAVIAPYGDEPGKQELHGLELVSLVFVWLTLWAGSVFNTYPRCMSLDPAMNGKILEWCTALSIVVGGLNILVFVIIALSFIYLSAKPTIQKKLVKVWDCFAYVLCCRCCIKKPLLVTEEQTKEMNEIFKQFDTDNSNTISEKELYAAFRYLGLQKTRDEIHDLFVEVDHDESGEIDHVEFMDMMMNHKNDELLEHAKQEKRKKRMSGLFINTIPMVDNGKQVKHHHHHHHHHHFYDENNELSLETLTSKEITTDTAEEPEGATGEVERPNFLQQKHLEEQHGQEKEEKNVDVGRVEIEMVGMEGGREGGRRMDNNTGGGNGGDGDRGEGAAIFVGDNKDSRGSERSSTFTTVALTEINIGDGGDGDDSVVSDVSSVKSDDLSTSDPETSEDDENVVQIRT